MGIIAKYRCGFYYEQLNIDQQFLYRRAASSISCYQPEMPVNQDDEDSLHKVLKAIQYDNPELFYWSADNSVAKNGRLLFCYTTDCEEEAIRLVNMTREKRLHMIKTVLEAGISQIDLLSKIYDYLVQHVEYADDELQKPDCAPWIYDIQGPLLHERGVCLGIAQTINYICIALHIPAILVTGEAKVAGWHGNHGWNLVKIDEQYYHVDATCEICDDNQDNKRKYFLKEDEDFADHQWQKALYTGGEKYQ